jgi:hypothetical protein
VADTPEPRTVGLLCGCIPAEPVLAAGLRPLRVTGKEGVPAPSPALPPVLCAHVRGCAARLAGPEGAGLAAILMADGCHPMRRLRDFLETRDDAPPVRLLRIPRRRTPDAVRELAGELRELARFLSALPGASPATAERLAETFGAPPEPGVAPGSPAPQPESAGKGAAPRLWIRGSYFLDERFLETVRRLGGEVVAVDGCDRPRPGTPPLVPDPGADPFATLADWCLRRPACPRAAGTADGGDPPGDAASLPDGADGVILLRMMQCTPQAYELPEWRDRLRDAGIPLLVLEADRPDWLGGQAVTRIEAFLESLKERALGAR